jgi:hypothetical protein
MRGRCGFLAALAFLWTQAAFADETNVKAQETFCFETRGPDAKHPDRVKGATIQCPTVDVNVLLGGTVSMGADAAAKLSPAATVRVGMPLASWLRPPRLHVQMDLSALPGQAASLEDPETWRSLEFRLGVSQSVHDTVNADLYAEAGFATRLPGELEARDRAVRWLAAGVRLGRFGAGWLSLGMGVDQRLDGEYRPAVLLAGAIQLYDGDRLVGGHVYLVGDAVLGLDYYGSAPRRDVVRVGLAVGR